MKKKRSGKPEVKTEVTPGGLQTITGQQVAQMTKQVTDIPTVYYNHARVVSGYFDFRIFFGEQTVSPSGQVSFTESVCVAMTPEFANLFLSLFSQQVAAFAKLYGAFREVPNNSEEFRKLIASMEKTMGPNLIKQ